MYHTAQNFGRSKFWQIANFFVLASFNLTNLWPCAIEHTHTYIAQNGRFLFLF